MAKSLFKSIYADIKKKRVFMISQELLNKLEMIELEAEKQGVSFPLNEHVEMAIRRLVQAADKELQMIESVPQSDNSEAIASLSDDDALLGANEHED